MKKNYFFRLGIIVFFFTFLLPAGGQAQRYSGVYDSLKAKVASQPDTMRHGFFHAARFNSTFHVQFEGEATYLYGQGAMLTGFEAAWVVNHKLSLGAKFDILTSQVSINKYINTLDSVPSGKSLVPNPIHPGSTATMLTFGYIFRSDKKISIEANLGLGWTHFTFTDPKTGWIDTTETKIIQFSSNYFIINPSVSVIWNSTKYFRIGAVAGVQGVFGTDYLELETYKIRSVYGGIFMRFGTF